MKIIKIKSSIMGDKSHSNKMVDFIAEKIKKTYVLEYDLSKFKVPLLDQKLLEDINNKRHSKEKEICDRLVADVKGAETLIIGAPMYSFTYPVQLKAYFDAIARQGETFKYCKVEKKPIGLSGINNAFVVLSRGGIFTKEEFGAVEETIKKYLEFIGVKNIYFIYMHGMSMGDDNIQKYTQLAKDEVLRILNQRKF